MLRALLAKAILAILSLSLSLFALHPVRQEPEPQAEAPTPAVQGKLVIVGGGGTTEPIQKAALMLTGKEKPRVLVLPQASSTEDRGRPSVEMWEKAGAGTVVNLESLEDRRRALREMEQADLIWFPGGSQLRLTEALAQAELIEELQRRLQAGAVIGGTSAGAAAMGEVMIEGAPDPAALLVGAMRLHAGLNLVPSVIVDQHFTARNRQARLLTAVLDRPDQIGIGIDERTAVVVEGRKLLVIGEGNVFLYDARDAERLGTDPGQRQGATGVRMHVLREGMEWTW